MCKRGSAYFSSLVETSRSYTFPTHGNSTTPRYPNTLCINSCNTHADVRAQLTATAWTRYSPWRDVTTAGPPRCPVWCRLVTVPTDPATTFTSPTGPFLSESAKCQPGKHPEWRNRTSDCESNGRFWTGNPKFLFAFHSNRTSISLSFGDIRVWQTDGRNTEGQCRPLL